MSSSPAIATDALTRRFGDHLAVDGGSLNVPARTVYGFLGPNGAGKSTTIRMLLGLLQPTAGTVHLLGRPLAAHREALLREVGALVEAPSLYDHLTGRENLTVTGRLRGGVPDGAVDRVLDTVDLRTAADRRVGTYSLGMRQRLGLALALLDDPSLLLLDEPTNGLDPAGMREMRTLLRTLPQRADVTVFLSSHLLGEVERVASHVGILQNGRLLFQGRTEDLRRHQDPRVVLRTGQPDAAHRVLTRADLQAEPGDGDRLVVRPGTEAVAARCTTLLVEAGLDVYHVGLNESSLEDTFLSLTDAPR
jgi:ABC-2 type transport system ATP-binding protein